MKNGNVFRMVKATAIAMAGAFGGAFGWMGWLLAAWVLCMAADYVSGSAVAIKAGGWHSRQARNGLWGKAGMIFSVGVAAMLDRVLQIALENLPSGVTVNYAGLLLPLTLCWYTLTELGSILENAHALGAILPEFLTNALAVAQKTEEKQNKSQEKQENGSQTLEK